MSAGFGVGFSRQFTPDNSLEERLSVLSELLKESRVERLRDFVHPNDRPEWGEVMSREQYLLLELTRDGWSWLGTEETQRVQQEIGQHWSDSGSYEDCFMIRDEETSLILPGVPREGLEGNGKAVWSHPSIQVEGPVVYAETGDTIEQLEGLIRDPELDLEQNRMDLLLRALGLLQICQKEKLPFYLAWG